MNTKMKYWAESSPHLDPKAARVTKKNQILSLYASGITDVEDLAVLTDARPSYVASVLQTSHLLSGYHDLYTSSRQPMNVYGRFFAGKLRYKDEEAAKDGVDRLDHFYCHFDLIGDRAGQHHALMMALTMYDRARWTGKQREADVYRRWLLDHLQDRPQEQPTASQAQVEAAVPQEAPEVPQPPLPFDRPESSAELDRPLDMTG
jgi:hypothetical protein